MSRQSRQGRMNALHWRNEVQKAQLGDNIANNLRKWVIQNEQSIQM